MDVETMQTTSQVVIVVGILATAAGGFGSYYFGTKAETARRAELQTSLFSLESKLAPFVELAREARPDADQEAALAGLREDIEELRELTSKGDFTPLATEIRARLVESIRGFAREFPNARMSVKITHETWTNPATREYAAQLASLLREGGIEVNGPEQITFFLVTPSSPIEWGYNEADVARVEKLYAALAPVMGSSERWTKAAHQEPGAIRLHFGGGAVVGPDGLVELE